MLQIVGARGLLGQAVVAAAHRQQIPYIDICHGDICDWTPLSSYGAVINCAGIVPQRSATAVQLMHANVVGPWHLAETCDDHGLRLVHISTDCVFAGPGPHAENDPSDATSPYARSKLAGEIIHGAHLTVRTSFVGEGRWPGHGLVDTLRYGTPIKASANLLWSGHTVWTVANILVQLALRPQITGLLHIPGEFQTRATLVDRLQAHLETTAPVTYDDTFVADRRLISTRWDQACPDLTPPPFAEQLIPWGHL